MRGQYIKRLTGQVGWCRLPGEDVNRVNRAWLGSVSHERRDHLRTTTCAQGVPNGLYPVSAQSRAVIRSEEVLVERMQDLPVRATCSGDADVKRMVQG